MIPEKYRLKNTIKYPTSLLIGGLTKLGLEIADSLIEQGGYVIIIDTYTPQNISKLDVFPKDTLVSFLDYTSISNLDEEIRRLDYVFYFAHENGDSVIKIPTQEFLSFSNYFDAVLSLATKFDAKFLLTTSIKAHQMVLLNEQNLNINYGPDASVKHTIYTNLEIQRYAESLTMEYSEKVNLDARIVRVAEIIGDGIDFDRMTSFVELVLYAARGEIIKLKKDGLETEFLIHILDAAYGIIKAQFSQNTKGEIFSLSYENAVSHLSIAYNIQEVESDAKEIQFIDEKNNLPSLRLYKPAPNLSQIGWSTRVPLEKAIKQSIAAAKIHLLESKTGGPMDTNSNTKSNSKLRGFMDLAGAKSSAYVQDDSSGPISKLIAERKRQEELKKQSLEYASNSIKVKRKRRPRSFNEKFQYWMWANFLSLGNNFSIFKNRSPIEIGFIFIFLIFGIAFYFVIFSPGVILARDSLSLMPDYQKISSSLQNNKFSEVNLNAQSLEKSLTNIDNILSRYEWLANTVALNNNYKEIRKTIQSSLLYLEGLENLSFSYAPLEEYLQAFSNNTQVRTGTDSYLSVSSLGNDYENTLLEYNSRLPYLQLGLDKMAKGYDQLKTLNLTLLPPQISNELSKVINETSKYIQDKDKFTSAQYFTDMMGTYGSKTYLVLLLDNTRPRPIGGDLAAFALFTVNNGSITEIVVQSANDVKFNLTSIDSSILEEINNTRFTYKSLGDLTINDLGTIQDYSRYSDVIAGVYRDTYNRKVDVVVSLNYSTVEQLLKNFSNKYSVEINQVDFSKGELLTNLKLAQDSNESIVSKYRVSAQLLSTIFNTYLDDLSKDFPVLISTFNTEIDKQNIMINAPTQDYQEHIEKSDMNLAQVNETNSYFKVGLNFEDQKVVNVEKFPSITTFTEINIDNKDPIEYKNVNIKFPSAITSQEISVCVPLNVPDSSISVTNIPDERVVINASDMEKCIVAKVFTENELNLTWKAGGLGTGQNSAVSFVLGQSKVRGSFNTVDYIINLDETLELKKIEPQIEQIQNTLRSTQVIEDDLLINLTLDR